MMKVPPPGISVSLTRPLLLFFFLFSSFNVVLSNSKWRNNGEKTTQKDTKDTESGVTLIGTEKDCVRILVTASEQLG